MCGGIHWTEITGICLNSFRWRKYIEFGREDTRRHCCTKDASFTLNKTAQPSLTVYTLPPLLLVWKRLPKHFNFLFMGPKDCFTYYFFKPPYDPKCYHHSFLSLSFEVLCLCKEKIRSCHFLLKIFRVFQVLVRTSLLESQL